MAILDNLKSLVGGHKKEAKEGVEKAGQAAEDKMGGAHAAQVDAVEKKADQEIDSLKEGGNA